MTTPTQPTAVSASPKKSAMWRRYAIDPQAAADGTWVSFDAGVEICLRSQSARVVRAKGQEINRRNRAEIIKTGDVPLATEERDQVELLQVIVVDWTGVTDEDGNALACTEATVAFVLGHPAMVELKQDVLVASRSAETFRAAVLEEMAGNSSATSAITSAAAPSEPVSQG